MNSWGAMRVMVGMRRAAAASTGLALLLCAACGDDGDGSIAPDEGTAGNGRSAGGSDAPAADAGPSGAGSGAGESSSGGGSSGGGQHELFTDSSVPDCLVPGAPWKLEGSIGSQRIMLGSDVFSSRLAVGELRVIGGAGDDDGGVADGRDPLILTWEGSVKKGEVEPLTGKRFLLPDDPERPSGYCISAGEIGPSTHPSGALFKFRIRSVRRYAMGACTGAEQPAALAGCMFRPTDVLP